MTNGTTTASKLWYLSQIKIFASMTPPEMEELARITRMTTTPKYQAIYLPGDAADAVYLLKKGRVRISKLSSEGKQVTLALLEPGDIFGELALMDDGGPQETIAEALEETLLCLIPKADFEMLLRRYPDVSLRVTKFIGWRLRSVENKVEDIVFRSAPGRLAHLLLKLADDYGQPGPDGTMIGVKFTHQNIAELINATRQTVTELLNQFESRGLIATAKRRLVLRDREALGRLADPGTERSPARAR